MVTKWVQFNIYFSADYNLSEGTLTFLISYVFISRCCTGSRVTQQGFCTQQVSGSSIFPCTQMGPLWWRSGLTQKEETGLWHKSTSQVQQTQLSIIKIIKATVSWSLHWSKKIFRMKIKFLTLLTNPYGIFEYGLRHMSEISSQRHGFLVKNIMPSSPRFIFTPVE